MEEQTTGQQTSLFAKLFSKISFDRIPLSKIKKNLFPKKKDVAPTEAVLEKPEPPKNIPSSEFSNTQNTKSSEEVAVTSSEASASSSQQESEQEKQDATQKDDKVAGQNEETVQKEHEQNAQGEKEAQPMQTEDGASQDPLKTALKEAITGELQVEENNSSSTAPANQTSQTTSENSSSDSAQLNPAAAVQPPVDKEALLQELRSALLQQLKEELKKEMSTLASQTSIGEPGGDFGKIKELESLIEKANGSINEQATKIKEYSKKIDDFEKKTEDFNLTMYELTTKKFNPFITQAQPKETAVQEVADTQQESSSSPEQVQTTPIASSPHPTTQVPPQGMPEQAPQYESVPSQDYTQRGEYTAHEPKGQSNNLSQEVSPEQAYRAVSTTQQPLDNRGETQAINVSDSISGNETSLYIPKQEKQLLRNFVSNANKLPSGVNAGLQATEKIVIEDTVDVPNEDTDEVRERIILEERWHDAELKKHPDQLHPKMKREDMKSLLHTFMHTHEPVKKRVSAPRAQAQQSKTTMSQAIATLQHRYDTVISQLSREQKGRLQVRLALARLPNDLHLLRKTQEKHMYTKISQSLEQLELVAKEQ